MSKPRKRWQQFSEKLAEVEALTKTGKYHKGLESARILQKKANSVDYRPILAEVLYRLGELLDRIGEYKGAETALYDAAREAGDSRDALLAAKAMVELVFVVGHNQARHEAGLLIAKDAEVMLSVAAGDERIRSSLLNKMGVVYYNQGEYAKALEYYRKSLAICEKILGPEHTNKARTLNNIGVVYNEIGEYAKALIYYRKSLAMYKKSLGPDHPYVAQLLNNIGGVLDIQGEHDQALEFFIKTLAIRERALGPEHRDVAKTLNNMGLVFQRKGEDNKALTYFRKSLAIREKALGPKHPSLARALMGLGIVFVDQGMPQH